MASAAVFQRVGRRGYGGAVAGSFVLRLCLSLSHGELLPRRACLHDLARSSNYGFQSDSLAQLYYLIPMYLLLTFAV